MINHAWKKQEEADPKTRSRVEFAEVSAAISMGVRRRACRGGGTEIFPIISSHGSSSWGDG
ncbi:hypothetical protein [Sphingobium mellinum]|uniref:hypothetical protein n=1 Tax=Sphingobium mellinum TaxID=1387166 RepID=UPI0030ED5D82